MQARALKRTGPSDAVTARAIRSRSRSRRYRFPAAAPAATPASGCRFPMPLPAAASRCRSRAEVSCDATLTPAPARARCAPESAWQIGLNRQQTPRGSPRSRLTFRCALSSDSPSPVVRISVVRISAVRISLTRSETTTGAMTRLESRLPRIRPTSRAAARSSTERRKSRSGS